MYFVSNVVQFLVFKERTQCFAKTISVSILMSDCGETLGQLVLVFSAFYIPSDLCD